MKAVPSHKGYLQTGGIHNAHDTSVQQIYISLLDVRLNCTLRMLLTK